MTLATLIGFRRDLRELVKSHRLCAAAVPPSAGIWVRALLQWTENSVRI
ncbi:hypothetical protein EVA_10231 [gut metagenome]|uniref:Uncharacterized protein n=1 Tax=gut metagenome TaxID=749906 RepID=J9G487_9ZZZZ